MLLYVVLLQSWGSDIKCVILSSKIETLYKMLRGLYDRFARKRGGGRGQSLIKIIKMWPQWKIRIFILWWPKRVRFELSTGRVVNSSRCQRDSKFRLELSSVDDVVELLTVRVVDDPFRRRSQSPLVKKKKCGLICDMLLCLKSEGR